MEANIGSATKLGHYLFLDCINIASMTILQVGQDPDTPDTATCRELPPGCFCSTGLQELRLPRDFYELGAHACDNCKLLTQVDISRCPPPIYSTHNSCESFHELRGAPRTGHSALIALHRQ